MLATAVLNFLTLNLNFLLAGLPAWSITFGTAPFTGTDGGIVFGTITWLLQYDKYLPIHDGAALWFSCVTATTTAMYVYRLILLILNLARGSGAK